jgi:hypothetical protein
MPPPEEIELTTFEALKGFAVRNFNGETSLYTQSVLRGKEHVGYYHCNLPGGRTAIGNLIDVLKKYRRSGMLDRQLGLPPKESM